MEKIYVFSRKGYIFLRTDIRNIRIRRYSIIKGLRNILLEEQARLETIIDDVKTRLKHAPQGSLRLSKSHNHIQYYCCDEENKSGHYIPKDEFDLACKLAQKSYDKKALELAEKRMSQIRRITKDYKEDELEKLFLSEHVERQKLIKPIEKPWEQKVAEWKTNEYKGKEFQPGAPIILTEKGERVRSKSEKIMADYFYRNGIEYKYECPLYLKGVGIIYPDFTFLSRKSGEEIYWEHNGMIDEPKYARNMVKKINAYENNGIFVGERLILTYETEETILNTGKIEEMVKRYL